MGKKWIFNFFFKYNFHYLNLVVHVLIDSNAPTTGFICMLVIRGDNELDKHLSLYLMFVLPFFGVLREQYILLHHSGLKGGKDKLTKTVLFVGKHKRSLSLTLKTANLGIYT